MERTRETTGPKLSREEFRQRQELEAARKAGTAPAEVDVETGKDINPHIPQYISQAPWYLDAGAPTLKHQRSTLRTDFDQGWYQRGLVVDRKVTKFRKGACENCGAMTHTAKTCTERPRKQGAKITGSDIKPDEVVEEFDLDWDSKRDRWNGYNPDDYSQQLEGWTISEWQKIDEYRNQLRAKEIDQQLLGKHKRDSDDEEEPEDSKAEADGDKYADEADMAGTKVDLKRRTTVRNLRIREDTAKYLLNLDVNSAYYDPKTRSMRDNPLEGKEEREQQATFAGDNFVRQSGESVVMNKMQVFAWQAYEKGQDVNLQADPTKVELLNKEFEQKRNQLKSNLRDGILAKYGGEEHLQAPPKEMLLSQTEHYVEYSRTGQVVKGQEPAVPRSKYEEDVYPNNHKSVWGSYWEAGQWGYACCGQNVKNSFCTGAAGFEARKRALIQANQ